ACGMAGGDCRARFSSCQHCAGARHPGAGLPAICRRGRAVGRWAAFAGGDVLAACNRRTSAVAAESLARIFAVAAGNARARTVDLRGKATMAHAHGPAAVKLQYQPALPIGRGKLCLWLFLSTEIMFFAGLIGTYIVLRFGAPPGTWPAPHDVHLQEYVGAFNTFVLICSSVTIVLALEAAKGNQTGLAKFWMVLTFLLGSLFLGVKAYEYNEKFKHGIYPMKPHSRIYEKADLFYVQGVKLSLTARRDGLNAEQNRLQQENKSLSQEQADELALSNNLLTNLVQWTE